MRVSSRDLVVAMVTRCTSPHLVTWYNTWCSTARALSLSSHDDDGGGGGGAGGGDGDGGDGDADGGGGDGGDAVPLFLL